MIKHALVGLLLLIGSLQASAQGVSPSQLFGCNQATFYDGPTTPANTTLVNGIGSTRIYVCGFDLYIAQPSSGTSTVGLVYGTGVNCATPVKITPAFNLTGGSGLIDHLPVYTGLLPVPSGNNLCVTGGTLTLVQVIVYYTQF